MSTGFRFFFRKISTFKSLKSPVRNTLNVAFGKYLFLTNTLSCGGLMFLGDIIQQEMEYQQKKLLKRYDYSRLTRMFLVGLGMGPVHHYYYDCINRVFPKRDMRSITKKILMDQFVMSPICIAQFFYSLGLLEMRSLTDCTKELKNHFLEIYKTDWCVWPPIQFVNFYIVPDKYRVVYINIATMLYNVFLSYVKHREQAQKFHRQLTAKKED